MGTALRRQTLIDMAASLFLTLLAWPFPLARANMPVIAHVLAILIAWQIVQAVYFAVTAGVWGQTGGMRLLGLELIDDGGEAASAPRRACWGALAGLSALGGLVFPGGEEPGIPERLTSVRVRLID